MAHSSLKLLFLCCVGLFLCALGVPSNEGAVGSSLGSEEGEGVAAASPSAAASGSAAASPAGGAPAAVAVSADVAAPAAVAVSADVGTSGAAASAATSSAAAASPGADPVPASVAVDGAPGAGVSSVPSTDIVVDDGLSDSEDDEPAVLEPADGQEIVVEVSDDSGVSSGGSADSGVSTDVSVEGADEAAADGLAGGAVSGTDNVVEIVTGGEGGSGVEEDSGEDGLEESKSDESDLLAVDIDCTGVPDFPNDIFIEHPDNGKVYANPAKVPEGIFSTMGFDRFVSVFGVHIVGSKGVSDSTLRQAAHVFAGVVDNDGDGKPDSPGAIESVRKYNTVIGYVEDPDDSDHLWKTMYVKDANQGFRDQFACNMHFFEQWASDATPEFYIAMKERKPEECTQLDEVEFDWRLWYFPFTVTYYGYLEDFPAETLGKINEAMDHARKEEVFFGNYPDDDEMEVADFFVWSLLTKLGALECHCKSDIIETVWKVCTAQALKEIDPEWFELLGKIEGIPSKLPTGRYTGSALVPTGGGEEQSSAEDAGAEISTSDEVADKPLKADDLEKKAESAAATLPVVTEAGAAATVGAGGGLETASQSATAVLA
eukprot:GHVS01089125.1.p1 GENE.GHVS01089125.1~~GHVS01089125.1.p1  ORF type:complete len:601 (+),score=147.26 GHVS01089125.1:461-2263(+)